MDKADEILAGLVKKKVDAEHVSWLFAGDCGTGKTHLTSTARTPILYYMFDPGGADLPVIKRLEAENRAVIVRDFEQDDIKKPSAFTNWEMMHGKFKLNGVYEKFGTVVIDSLSTFGRSVLNQIVFKQGRPGGAMQQNDWGIYLNAVCNSIKDCCSLPCDFILTAHLDMQRDDITGSLITSLDVPGASSKVLPRLFSEIYITDTAIPNSNEKSIDYRVITKPYGRYRARTRIGSEAFSLFETPNVMELRKKAGYEQDHKPALGGK